ncbi:MAG: phosphatase PAP2 family protein [Chloroflexota bacterium]|nr:phosphatase PAP2 family protein [Chloroflexota bacterium]
MRTTPDAQETPVPPPSSTRTAGGEGRHSAHIRHIIEGIFWIVGLVVLAVASVMTRSHHDPWPGDVGFSHGLQSLNLGSIGTAFFSFMSSINNPIPSAITLALWFFFMLIMYWYRQAVFLLMAVGVGDFMDVLIGDYVSRPRPSPHIVHVVNSLQFNSFPSGHSEHVMVYYGFLLYLSLSKRVREWRYHWFLLPLQIFGVLNILMVGLARLEEGEHWLTDVLAGYLSGAIWLLLFIFLYRAVSDFLDRRRAGHIQAA